jgi:hypothetical protein
VRVCLCDCGCFSAWKNSQVSTSALSLSDSSQLQWEGGDQSSPQASMSADNSAAWVGEDTYAAWVKRFGEPTAAAAAVRDNPGARLGTLRQWVEPVAGAHVVNLLGSHGTKAAAMALLGAASATVVDVSPANARYGGELAAALGVDVKYVVCDVLELCEKAPQLDGSADLVVMEMGILHYFVDLRPLLGPGVLPTHMQRSASVRSLGRQGCTSGLW